MSRNLYVHNDCHFRMQAHSNWGDAQASTRRGRGQLLRKNPISNATTRIFPTKLDTQCPRPNPSLSPTHAGAELYGNMLNGHCGEGLEEHVVMLVST